MFTSRLFTTLLLASLSLSSVALAADTGSVILGGSVTTTLSITSVDSGTPANLPLAAGDEVVKVADIAMMTNNVEGLTFTASGTGHLTNGNAAHDILFTVMTLPDAATAPEYADFTGVVGADVTAGTTAAGAFAQDLYISYTSPSIQDPGTYAGLINLTVADK